MIAKRDPDHADEVVVAIIANPSYSKLRDLVQAQPSRIYRYNQYRAFLGDMQRKDDAPDDYPRVVLYFCADQPSFDSIHFTPSGFCLGYRG